MEAVNEHIYQELNMNNKLDALCQEFNGESFYGLEYIVEDFFQMNKDYPSVEDNSSIDWFGLLD